METKSLFTKTPNQSDDQDVSECEYGFTKITKEPKENFSAFQLFNTISSLKKSNSTPDLYSTIGFSKETKTVVEITKELLLAQKYLNQKTEECQWLRNQNYKLNSLIHSKEGSLFKRVFTTNKKKGSNLINADEQIQGLHQQIFEMETELENYKQLKERLDEIIREKIQLKLDFNNKSEIQNEILEDLKEKVKNREEKLIVERKLREQREKEISYIQSYLNKKENYYKRQLQLKEEEKRRIESSYMQDIETLKMIINQKEEELLQNDSNYTQNTDIITDKLLKLLQLKTKHVNESNEKLKKVQGLLKIKCEELENAVSTLESYKTKDETIKKLEGAKQQISEALNELEQEKDCVSHAKSTIDKGLEELLKQMGDKEEVH